MSWKDKFPKENRYYETDNGILYHGDSRDILSKFDNELINMVVTSPPYDNLRDYYLEENAWNYKVFQGISKLLADKIATGGVIVWVVADATVDGSETGTSFRQALYFIDECGLKLHDTMIYYKNGFAKPSSNRYHQMFEYMFVFSKGKPAVFNPIKDRKNKYGGETCWGRNTMRQKDGVLVERPRKVIEEYGVRGNVWQYVIGGGISQRDSIAYKHPATFPEALAMDHILSWSNEGDIVLDPFMGSGTTAKQCEKAGRRWIGIEISKEYCEIVKRRLMPISSSLF